MSWPPKIKDEVLVKCGRHCCICHKFSGLKMELHHIILKSEGGEETVDNCIPLCLDCHADMKSYDHTHPKGTKYSRKELRGHRDKWYGMVSKNLGTGSLEHLEQDQETFNKIIKLLPLKPTITYLRDFEFSNRRIHMDNIVPLYDFIEAKRQMPWLDFFDSDLQSLFERLIDSTVNFQKVIVTSTFPYKGPRNHNTVPREWRRDNPDRYNDVVNKLNSTSTEMYASEQLHV